MFEQFNKHDIAVYAGYITNNTELLECTSGGIATALARQMLKQGGYVVGVVYSDDFYKAQYEIVHQEEKLEKLKGSKYVEVDKGTIYADVKELLEAGESVLFFGLPCVVAAMRAFLKRDYEKLLAVELICHGPTLSEVHQQYIAYLEKKYKGQVVSFSVRRKNDAWTPLYLYARFSNGRIFQREFYQTEYGYAFDVLGRKSCYNCKFRGNNRTGDIMLGDFWGTVESDEYWNKNGVSAILVHTERGDQFLNATEGVCLYKTSFDRVVEKNPNIIKARDIHPEKERFEKLFNQHGLIYAVKHSRSYKMKIKIAVMRMLPKSVKKELQRFCNLIRK